MSGDGRSQVSSGIEPLKVESQPERYGLPEGLERIDYYIGRLDEELGMLYDSLGPVLRPEGPTPASDVEETPDISPIGQRTYRMAQKIEQMTRVIQDLRYRLDLT